MTCCAMMNQSGGEHVLSFLAVTPEEAAQGYCAKCMVCKAKFKSAVEWLITKCKARPDFAGREAGGR